MSNSKKLLQSASGYINQTSGGGDSSEAFSTWVYNGNGQTSEYYTKHENGINFADDGGMVWIKANDTNHKAVMVDTVRGANSIVYSDDTGAEFSNSSIVTQFYNNGFRIGNQNIVGQSGINFTSWSFKKQAKFFDIQTWNGNGTAGRQISHNLGCEPGMIAPNLPPPSSPPSPHTRSRRAAVMSRTALTPSNSCTSRPSSWAT
mgnify:CR=1 FL=1